MTSTPGSVHKGSRSSKFAIIGIIGTTMRSLGVLPPPGSIRRFVRRVAIRSAASSAGKSRTLARCGTSPSGCQPVLLATKSIPSANRVGSPRIRLTTKPLIRAASSAGSTTCVPTRLAITPPRSISPTSTTGACTACAKPILAISCLRRLTSEAEPAPSTRTTSACAIRFLKLAKTCGISCSLRVW